jgi:hypothetical protein
MTLYAAIGAEFKSSLMKEFESLLDERIKSVITKTLKQVAHDYELNYKELKSRYCSKESLDEYELPGNTQVVTVDLEESAEHSTKTPEPVVRPKAKAASAVMALSKMKKGDLVQECEERGLDSEGTVSQLKERVKDARDKESPPVKEKKKAPAPKKEEKKASAPKEKKKKKEEVPPPAPVVLKEDPDEEEDEEEDDGDICQRVDDEDEEFDVPGEAEGDVLRERLRKMLATVHDEEEDYEEED